MERIVLCSNYFFNRIDEEMLSIEAVEFRRAVSHLIDEGYMSSHENITIISANKTNVKKLIKEIRNGQRLSMYFTESIKLMKCENTYNQLMECMIENVTPFYLITGDRNEKRHFERKIDNIGIKVFKKHMQKIKGGV